MYFPQKWPSIGHLDALLAKTLITRLLYETYRSFVPLDSDSFSSGDSDEDRKKSHRRVRSSSSRREVLASNKREIRSSRRQQSAKLNRGSKS